MIDFSRVRNYYIACGYTDMRKQIDGAPNAQSIPVPDHERKPKRSRKEIYDSIPAEKEIITLPEDRRLDSR